MHAERDLADGGTAGRWERDHGGECTCRLLAAAAGADPSVIDYRFCSRILQKRWRMKCDHVPEPARPKITPLMPPHDARDPVQLALIVNADTATER